MQQALAAAERVYEFLDENPDIADRPGSIDLPDAVVETNGVAHAPGDAVAFENVTFAYDEGKPVLHDVSLAAQPGQIVALVGHTGAALLQPTGQT